MLTGEPWVLFVCSLRERLVILVRLVAGERRLDEAWNSEDFPNAPDDLGLLLVVEGKGRLRGSLAEDQDDDSVAIFTEFDEFSIEISRP